MLLPRKTKYRKKHRDRGCLKGNSSQGSTITFGTYAMKAVSRREITSRQIESARKAINGHLKRAGKVWIRVYPDKPITRKAAEVPMGSGKGSVEFWVMPVKPGRILFELEGVSEEQAREAFRLGGHKLPISTKFIMKEHV